MFNAVDALITDVSSVGLDFLYLRPEKPLILTDRRNDLQTLNSEAPISRATPVINDTTALTLNALVAEALDNDTSAEIRSQLRTYYFGDGSRGTSTQQFFDAITALIDQRTLDLTSYHDSGSSAESAE